jgi:hypothetical protein
MEQVDFQLPAFFLKKELGRSTLPEVRTEQIEMLYVNLFNLASYDVEESKRMDASSNSMAQKSMAYHEASFEIKHNFKCALRIMHGRAGRLVVALALQYGQREVIIEYGERFIELFDEPLGRVLSLYGERIVCENVDMRITRDTYGHLWFVLKEEIYWNAAELTNHRSGRSIVFSERLWNLVVNCLQRRVKPVLPDMVNICRAFNGILGDLKLRARADIKAKCKACQRPDSGAQFMCRHTTGDKIKQIFKDIISSQVIAAPGTLLNSMWSKIEKMLPVVEKELRAEMHAEEHLLMKYHANIPNFLSEYVPPEDDKIPREIDELFDDM